MYFGFSIATHVNAIDSHEKHLFESISSHATQIQKRKKKKIARRQWINHEKSHV